jgi:hypothetical protein
MLGFDHSCICHLFPIGWSPYSFRCSGTCSNWYFSLLVGIMGDPNFITLGCSLLSPSLWKSCVIVVSSFTLFFDGPPTWTKVFHISSRCSVQCYVNKILILCKSSCECLVISPSYHTYILFVSASLPYIVTYPLWLVTSYYYTSFTLSMWTYHWWFRYPFDSVPMWEWM